MVKNWLIRTKNNHILGPVSKEKIRELISNGSIKGDDEICAGNGYWIHVREQDLIARYIMGDESQPFNPVQEAEPVFALSPDKNDLEYPAEDDVLPAEADLEYPDLSGSQTDATQVGMSLADLQEDLSSGEMDLSPKNSDSKKKKPMKMTTRVTEEVPIPSLKKRHQTQVSRKAIKRQTIFEGKNLIFLLIFFLVVAVYLLANRSAFIKEIINRTSYLNPFPEAVAQTIPATSKKKTGKIDSNLKTRYLN